MKLHRAYVVAGVVALLSGAAGASPTTCPQFFAGGRAPDLQRVDLAERGHQLCFSFYSVAESGVSRTAIWSAEHLTRASVESARRQKRVDAFHSEAAIGARDRAEREDYLGSGRDEGHMSPSGDMPDERSQFESFSLANMVPQSPDNNRHLWQGIEIATRALAKYDGELYVVTGPAFIGPRASIGRGVEVPTHVWKAIYDPQRGAAAYITLNQPGEAYAVISIADLTRATGVDPFPALPDRVKAAAIGLPTPRPGGQRLSVGPVGMWQIGIAPSSPISSVYGQSAPLVEEGRTRERWHNERLARGAVRTLVRALRY
ncbi:DNA/RNA non-specific endonuclease [Burkholderia sp. Se-20373]|uniref:DNA/RNA non-specific endonuclease n=1 Tax=Burkholderia sp. Se-20373 TaxID=2703898 RepID=UPI00197CD169|nr:DNA/RNA non-specific endonuclease [Burkholderia sp. Se-20373]MBN3744708.1 DNA/RNA non-specific endonuclease [Burkholderia sp. Se-20373]